MSLTPPALNRFQAKSLQSLFILYERDRFLSNIFMKYSYIKANPVV